MVRRRQNTSTRVARYPGQVSRSNDAIHTRTFRGRKIVYMQSSSTIDNGFQGYFSVAYPIGDYVGTDFISQCFDQYRVKNVQVLMRPSATLINGGDAPTSATDSIKFQTSIYSLMNGTHCAAFIDYDTDVNPTEVECLQRPNLKLQSLKSDAWTMIASFSPKTLSNQSGTGAAPNITFNSSTWLDTTNLNAKQFGVRGMINNASPLWAVNTNEPAVELMVTATVEMRGPKNEFTTSSSTLLAGDVKRPLGTRHLVAELLSPVDETRL